MLSTVVTRAVDTAVANMTVTQGLLVAILAVIFIKWASQKSKKMKLPPGPPTLPLFGNAFDFKDTTLAKKTKEWIQKHGPVVQFYTGLQRWVVLGNLEVVTEAYTQRGSDFANKPSVTSLDYVTYGGKNIAFAKYSDALVYRRKIAMLAIRQYLTGIQHTDRIHSIVTQTIEDMLSVKGKFCPHEYLSHIQVNILHDICFGYTFKINDPTYRQLLESADEGFGDITGHWEDYFPLLAYFPTKKYRQYKKYIDFFRGHVEKHVSEHRANFDETRIDTLVDNILLAQKQTIEGDKEAVKADFTDVHIGCLVMDVFAAGIDTSRNTLDFVFLTLAVKQDVQKKMQVEIDSATGGNMLGREHRLGLVYTEAVIMEVMRMYPVVPVGLPHETMRDTQVGGYDIPAKTQILVNQDAIMNDPAHWEKPEVFMPERFIEKGGEKLKPRPKSWMPFSMGPRNCIGEFLARTTVLYTVANLLQKLHFSLAPGTEANFEPMDKYLFNNCRPFEVVVTPRESF